MGFGDIFLPLEERRSEHVWTLMNGEHRHMYSS
jgi:hypothetical protein